MSPLDITPVGLVLLVCFCLFMILAVALPHRSPYERQLRRLKGALAEAERRGCTRDIHHAREAMRAFVHGGWREVCR